MTRRIHTELQPKIPQSSPPLIISFNSRRGLHSQNVSVGLCTQISGGVRSRNHNGFSRYLPYKKYCSDIFDVWNHMQRQNYKILSLSRHLWT